MARFINLIVTNGGSDAMGFILNPGMDGDNLINTDIIVLVGYTLSASEAKFDISTTVTYNDGMTDQVRKYRVYASKARTGTYTDGASLPSANWMVKAKKVILEAVSNQGPGGNRTTVVFLKDGTDHVYLRGIEF